MTFDEEPRTHLDIIRDLLEFTQDREWTGETNTSCSCHPEYARSCPECGSLEYPHKGDPRTHTENCRLAKLISETEAYLRIEEGLAQERENGEALPHHPH